MEGIGESGLVVFDEGMLFSFFFTGQLGHFLL
jgi:hypothetical protein